jgi:hypothetical protein
LLLPKIDFDFNFPTDPAVKDDVGTYLSDENNRSQQALSVIITQSFNPGTGNGTLTDQVATTSEQVISEFAFNKLNALIAQSNIKYLDLNIQSLNDASATLRFYNGRVIFTGSVFTVSGNNNLFANSSNLLNSNINNILTDFSGQYLIFPDGALRARYSYRLINTTTLNSIDQLSNQYVNGLGLVYQRDFDTFGEFLRNIFRSNKKQAVNPLPVPNSATPSVTARPSANQ